MSRLYLAQVTLLFTSDYKKLKIQICTLISYCFQSPFWKQKVKHYLDGSADNLNTRATNK